MSQVWRAAQSGLKTQLAPHIYENWIQPIQGMDDDGGIRLLVPSKFHAQWVQDNYADLLRETLQMEFRFEVGAEVQAAAATPQLRVIPGGQETVTPARVREMLREPTHLPAPSAAVPAPALPVETPVIPAHTPAPRFSEPAPVTTPTLPPAPVAFDPQIPFVEWDGQKMASHSLQLFLQSRDQLPFNPLFLKSAPGMGKTALLRQHIRRFQSLHSEARVAYISIPQFTQELVRAIQQRDVQKLQQRYQNSYDMLVVDDLQHLEGKKKTQEEFMHLVNFFILHRKPVVVLSQKWSGDLDLNESLRQRLQAGLCIEVFEMDRASQVQIFNGMSQGTAQIPPAFAHCLSQVSLRSVSDIAALWTRMKIHHAFSGQWPQIDQFKQWVRPHQKESHQISMKSDAVCERVCQVFRLTMEDFKGVSRKKSVREARRMLVMLLREVAGMCYQDIGELVGRHHSTIIHLLDSAQNLRLEDPVFERQYQFLKDGLTAR